MNNLTRISHSKMKIIKWIKKIIYLLYVFFKINLLRKRIRNNNFKKNNAKVLIEATKALESINIDFWLAFGTLLGSYREGKFISHDLDIDLGVDSSVDPQKVEMAMLKKGFIKTRYFECIDNKTRYISEQTFRLKNVDIDVFYFHKKDNQVWTNVFYKNEEKMGGTWFAKKNYFPAHQLSSIKFMGLEIKIPHNTEEYLRSHYGQDFMTPNKKWNCFNSSKNSIHSPNSKVYLYEF